MIHDTQSAQISQMQDEHNIYAIYIYIYIYIINVKDCCKRVLKEEGEGLGKKEQN